jgi:hypothetical protein
MRRVAVTFTCLALVYPMVAFVAAGQIGIAGPLTVAAVATLATLLLGVPAFAFCYRCGWLEWWQMALGGAVVGLVCALPFAVGGTVLAAALAPAFVALGLLHGPLFWVLALWRSNRRVRRPADARGDGTGQWVAT